MPYNHIGCHGNLHRGPVILYRKKTEAFGETYKRFNLEAENENVWLKYAYIVHIFNIPIYRIIKSANTATYIEVLDISIQVGSVDLE